MKLMPHVYQVAGVSLSHAYDAAAYLIEGTEGLYLLDCGTPDGFEAIIGNIQKLQFAPEDIRAVYGTHGHYDHVGAAVLFKQKYGCSLCLHEEDVRQVEEADPVKTTAEILYGRAFPPCQVDRRLADGDTVEFGNGIAMEVLHTPGHTPGGCCYYLEKEKALFSGDTLFCQSVGRTDFPGGSMSGIVRSIKDKLMVLPDEVKVYPGHMDRTSIGAERAHNPYL